MKGTSRARGWLRSGLRTIEPGAQRLGSRVLGSPRARIALNSLYETLGPRFAWLVTRFFSSATVSEPFVWTARLPSGMLLIPVSPDLERSWSNALVWRWPPNLPMRRFYADYTAYRQGCAGGGADDPRKTLFDVGANDGMHSCFFAVAGWDCVAFEPQPTCIAYLERIAGLNRFERILVEHCAVGAHSADDVEFFASDSTWFSSLDRASVERFEPARGLHVRMLTLDEYWNGRAPAPDCIKIDVEGLELSVIRGAARLIESVRPDLVIEVSAHASVRRGIWEQLAPLGYAGFVLPETWRDGIRSLGSVDEFVDAFLSSAHIDVVFTADAELTAHLSARTAGAQA